MACPDACEDFVCLRNPGDCEGECERNLLCQLCRRVRRCPDEVKKEYIKEAITMPTNADKHRIENVSSSTKGKALTLTFSSAEERARFQEWVGAEAGAEMTEQAKTQILVRHGILEEKLLERRHLDKALRAKWWYPFNLPAVMANVSKSRTVKTSLKELRDIMDALGIAYEVRASLEPAG